MNDTSIAALRSIDAAKLELQVLACVQKFGHEGCIQDQVLGEMPRHLAYSSVTARFRALLDKGQIVDTGERRPGHSGRSQRVLRAVEFTHA